MRPRDPLVLAKLFLVLPLLAACDVIAPPSATPEPTSTAVVVPEAPPARADVVACIDINPLECERVAAAVLAALQPARGEPFSIQVRLVRCADDVPACPPSLAARHGIALVEYADAALPVQLAVEGPPLEPVVQPAEPGVWTDPIQPGSPRAEGAGPFEFEVGHCGILHVVDFDGSFWVVSGSVTGEHQALFSSEHGSIRLLDPLRAEYRGSGNEAFALARFPGPKRFQLCD